MPCLFGTGQWAVMLHIMIRITTRIWPSTPHLHKNSSKFVENFLNYPADRLTNTKRQTYNILGGCRAQLWASRLHTCLCHQAV